MKYNEIIKNTLLWVKGKMMRKSHDKVHALYKQFKKGIEISQYWLIFLLSFK